MKSKREIQSHIAFFYPSFSYAQLTCRHCHFPKPNKIFKEVDDDDDIEVMGSHKID